MKNIYKRINKDVVGIQKVLQNRDNWHDEVEKYLMENHYTKHIRGSVSEEIWYDNGEVRVEHYNDIEVSFEYDGVIICLIERDNDGIVTVRFED